MSNQNILDYNDLRNYIVTKPGDIAILREPCSLIPSHTQIADISEYMLNNLATFPWGNNPEIPTNWDYQGLNGLSHSKWFVCRHGYRVGGAKNVRKVDGFYRFNQPVDQGISSENLSEN